MDFLNSEIGAFPLGIWISLIILGFIASANLIFQGISVINWDLALKWHVQEHSPDDPDPVNRTHMVMEWGLSVADVITHIVIAPLAIILTISGNYWGFVLSSYLYIFYLYVAIMATAQRYGLVKFGLKESFSEYQGVLTIVWVFTAVTAIGAISLWANPGYFGL